MRRVILVTGASSGIGAAIAAELAREGAVVGCLSRRGSVPAIDLPDGSVLEPLAADVTDDETVRREVVRFAEAYRGLNGVVNAAGFQFEAASASLDLDQVRSLFETNFVAALRVCQVAFPYLRAAGGFIINIGSFFDGLGVPGFLAYSASKAALASLTRTLAVEWAPHGVAVVNVAPGYVETDLNRAYLQSPRGRASVERLIPVKRVAQPEEIAAVVTCLAVKASDFLTGETIYVDGAQRIRL